MSSSHSSNTGGNSNNGKNGMFGRDEFNALLGGQDGLSEVLTRRSTTATSGGQHQRMKRNNTKDISDMTVEETAALMISLEQKKQKGHPKSNGGQQPQRLRAATNKVREYHKLVEEQDELLQHPTKQLKSDSNEIRSSAKAGSVGGDYSSIYREEDDDHDDTARQQQLLLQGRRRKKAAPLVIVDLGVKDRVPKLQSSAASVPLKPSRSEIRADAEDDDRTTTTMQPKQQLRSSSSSDDDSSIDRRRSRVLQKRQQQQVSTKLHVVANHDNTNMEPNNTTRITALDTMRESAQLSTQQNQPSLHMDVNGDDTEQTNISTMKTTTSVTSSLGGTLEHNKRGSVSDEDESGSEDESTSSSSSSEDDGDSESDDGIAKPMFVPKHKRTITQSLQEEYSIQLEKDEKVKEQSLRRVRESRVLVQQTVMNAKLDHTNDTDSHEQTIDGIIGAMNDVPTDDDCDDDDDRCVIGHSRYDDWEVRELERILYDWDVEVETIRQEQERNDRRRRYAVPRSKNDIDEFTQTTEHSSLTSSKATAMTKPKAYHHRGAFYMDDTEDNDIRQKAMEYGNDGNSTTVVLADHQHRDRTQLPKVMQVKKFGFANQSKYKGLAAEDTTDKSFDILPIVQNKGKSRRH